MVNIKLYRDADDVIRVNINNNVKTVKVYKDNSNNYETLNVILLSNNKYHDKECYLKRN